MTAESEKILYLSFHGRILDHLGIQMYQKPVAAIAEMISNSWDADAEEVYIELPTILDENAAITIKDNGSGMTFEECQERYLKVGWCRRTDSYYERSIKKSRPVLGRKGIGKFAGFGIAQLVCVETISENTGEYTRFSLDINQLRTGDYLNPTSNIIMVDQYLSPDESRKKDHGTIITLRQLKLSRCISIESFAKSMSRRFLLHQRAHDFKIYVNGKIIPQDEDLVNVEFSFPRDYYENERPEGLNLVDDWGIEYLSNGREIKWRINFYKDPIDEEELRGISIFSRGKLAQQPFFFNLSGGLGGQHGQEYMSGQVEADYIDGLDEDIIATERQRINWEHIETIPFEEWGQNRVKQLLRIWRDRRGEKRQKEIEEKVASFSSRLEKLPSYERRTVRGALSKLGSIPTLNDTQFRTMGEAVLQAWEQGRLKGLIDDLSIQKDISAEWLLSVLVEADVLVALNLAEAVRTKIEAIRGLKVLVEKGELENRIRDYIAEKPYLLHPKWETFRRETSVKRFMDDAAREADLIDIESGQRKRIDLALRSNEHLLIVEFMRPDKKADWDHLSRCQRYVFLIRDKIEAEPALGIRRVTGLIVADRLEQDSALKRYIEDLEKSDILAYSWESLLVESTRTWREFLEILGSRAPEDQRLQKLQKELELDNGG